MELAHLRVVEPLVRFIQDDDRVLEWSDRAEFAAQDCVDNWGVLRKAAVHVPPTVLIKKQPVLVWP